MKKIITIIIIILFSIVGYQYYNNLTKEPIISHQPNIKVNPSVSSSINTEVIVDLYFESGENLISEQRKVSIKNKDELPKKVIEELIKGPNTKSLLPTIPKGTKLNSITINNAKAIVDFSKEIIENHSGGTESENLTIYSVVNSLTELVNINKVEFLIDGQKRDIFKHYTLNDIFVRNETIIKK